MIHEASFGASGKTGEIEDRVDWIKRVQDQFLSIFAERCAEADPATATKKLSKRQIKDKWSRTDWWINAEEALEYGLVDEIDG
jgi:ATP-dependent protease ClpP protease subunit